ncbi:MAG: AMP-dependent synthetase/ligase [Actinomycetota bacterium]
MTRDITAEAKEIDAAVDGKTVCNIFQDAAKKFADSEALRWKDGDEWKSMTWAEYGEGVRDFAKGLIALGLKSGEFVNLIGSNIPEYVISDLGVLHAGGVPVSLYNTLAPEQIEYIINHCEAQYVICENRDYLERLLKVQNEIPNIRKVILWRDADEFADNDWIVSYEDIVSEGRKQDDTEYEKRWKAIDPEDLVTLIYTSGTTGPPKGVMVSHRNVNWTVNSFLRVMPLRAGTKQISYLPMAHIAERMIGHYGPLQIGSVISFCPDARQVAAYLRDVKPTWFFAVPRIWEKLYQGIQNAIEGSPDDQKQAAHDAIAVRKQIVALQHAGKDVPEDLTKKGEEAEPVVAFIRALVGLDEVDVAGTGAAPIAPEIIEFFWALGVELYEVYGQSEDTGPTSWNRPGMIKIGTVGPSIPGVEVKLADDGELLVRGGNVTTGYYKEPELTAETFDEEGWLHSGDVAEIDERGFIKIVDRKKEILITAGGKNIAPSNVENMLKQHPLIGQACMIADKRPYATALISLDPDDAAAWAKKQGKPTDLPSLSQDPDVVADIQAHIDQMNTRLHNQEQIKKFTILPMDWSVDSGEVTPTLKMKRKVVNQKFEDEVERMYA